MVWFLLDVYNSDSLGNRICLINELLSFLVVVYEQRGMVFIFFCNNMLDRNIDPQNRDGGGIDRFFFVLVKKKKPSRKVIRYSCLILLPKCRYSTLILVQLRRKYMIFKHRYTYNFTYFSQNYKVFVNIQLIFVRRK